MNLIQVLNDFFSEEELTVAARISEDFDFINNVDNFDTDPSSLKESGQNHPNWIAFCDSISSGKIYKKAVVDFLKWQATVDFGEKPLAEDLKTYFCELQKKTKPENPAVRRFAPTTFRPLAAIFTQFWSFTGYIIYLLNI